MIEWFQLVLATNGPHASSPASFGQLVTEGVVAFVTSLLLYRFARPMRVDRYWHTWLVSPRRLRSRLALLLAALSGPALVAISALINFTLTPQPWLDGFLLAFLGIFIVKLSVTFYGPPAIAQVLLLTSLGAAWLENDLDDRAEQAVASWSEAETYEVICRVSAAQYRVFSNHRSGRECDPMRNDLKYSLKDAESNEPDTKAGGVRGVREATFRLVIANHMPRSAIS